MRQLPVRTFSLEADLSERNELQGKFGETSKTSTQSFSPSLFVPWGVNSSLPEFENGEPAIVLNIPLLGSYQAAVTGWLNFAKLTVRALPAGSYMTASDPLGIHAVVT